MKTYMMKAGEIEKNWHLIDATDMVLGRLAAQVVTLLRGKHKASYTPHMDCGDHVVIINAEKIALTGNKWADKTYYRHTGYPGGIKSRTAGQILESEHPERLIMKAVERMLPRGPLGRAQLRHLRVYQGDDHQHEAQQPVKFNLEERNSKNKRGEA